MELLDYCERAGVQKVVFPPVRYPYKSKRPQREQHALAELLLEVFLDWPRAN